MDKPISNVNGEMSVNVKESSKTNQKKKGNNLDKSRSGSGYCSIDRIVVFS